MDGGEGEVEEDLGDEVAIAHGVERVLEAGVEAQLLGHEVRVDPEGGPGERPGAERGNVEAAPGRKEPVHVAGQSPTVRQEVVREEHRLGPLQVGVAGQECVARLGRAAFQGPLQPEHRRDDAGELGACEQPERSRDLVVAAATRVQLRPSFRCQLGHAALDGGVDVLVGAQELEAATRHFRRNQLQGPDQRVRLVAGEDARLRQPVDVRDRAAHVAGCQTFVECQAGREGHQGVRWGATHPVAPKGHSAPPWRAAQVWMPRPKSRTKPSASSCLKASAAS